MLLLCRFCALSALLLEFSCDKKKSAILWCRDLQLCADCCNVDVSYTCLQVCRFFIGSNYNDFLNQEELLL